MRLARLVTDFCLLLSMMASVESLFAQDTIGNKGKTVIIKTNVGEMKVSLYEDTPNHVKTFLSRAKKGEFDGTLFTRVIPEFMIQGGSPDSKNAPAGSRCGFGDRSTEILPETKAEHFNKKGALAAPRQNDDINPQKKSDMSQFFIVQGKVYRSGELDTLELIANQQITKKAMAEFFDPYKLELSILKDSNKREYVKRLKVIKAQVDSTILATPGHLIFTPEQREAYTTLGGCPHLDGVYTVYGEVVEGLDLIDKIAAQPRDKYDRPNKDVKIISIREE
jgi:peptidyl-prolyl cis-trans isomerase B (cyclophilin B)